MLKSCADLVAMLLVLPAVFVYRVLALVGGSSRALPGFAQGFALLPGTCGVFLRRAFYGRVLSRCERDSHIGFGVLFSHSTAEIGRSAYIGPYCVIGNVTIEEDVLIASQVSITNGSRQHGIERLDVPIREQPGDWPRVTIGADSWIGDRVVVMANVGRQCVVGAGSVVTKPLPDFAIAVGNPARIVRYRNADDPGVDAGQPGESSAAELETV